MRLFTAFLLVGLTLPSSLLSADANGQLIAVIAKGDAKAVKAAIASGADPESRDADGLTALNLAAKHGHPEIARILLAARASVLTKSTKGSPSLNFAAQNGNMEIVRLLAEGGAGLDLPGSDGTTPLVAASLGGHLEVVRYLVEKGAAVDVPGPKDELGHRVTPLWAASISGHLEIATLLLDRGAKINRTTKQDNVCMETAKTPHADMLRLLIKRGANIHYKNGSYTALYYAAFNGQLENVKILLNAGAGAIEGMLRETSFEPGSAGYKMLAAAVREKREPPARTFRDVENVAVIEPSADDKD